MGTPGPGGPAQALLTPGPRSDYAYLREHFREKHFLCEEGRCSTEQFTHAFRTEIDLKAHRTACHSRSRAEARQNRQIDLQFSYAPRHSRRNEGERSPHCLRSLQGSDAGPTQPLSVSGDDGHGHEHVGVGALHATWLPEGLSSAVRGSLGLFFGSGGLLSACCVGVPHGTAGPGGPGPSPSPVPA